jgi:hypothetical protein
MGEHLRRLFSCRRIDGYLKVREYTGPRGDRKELARGLQEAMAADFQPARTSAEVEVDKDPSPVKTG